MATVQDLIQTMVQGQQLMLARRAQEVSEAKLRTDRLNALIAAAEGIADPAKRDMLVQLGVSQGLGDEKVIRGILENVAPPTQTIAGQYALEGYIRGQATGENRELGRQAATRAATGGGTGQMSQERVTEKLLGKGEATLENTPAWENIAASMVTRLGSGQTPGQFALDQSLAGLDPALLRTASEMGLGLRMTAPQQAQIGFEWGNLANTSAYQTGSLNTQREIANADNQTRIEIAKLSARAAGGAGGLGDLYDNLRTSINLLESKKATLKQYDINVLGGIINSSVRMINAQTGSKISTLPSQIIKSPNGVEVEIIDTKALSSSFWEQFKADIGLGIRKSGMQ